jgi:uncharacterized protein YgiM (DUF1202 family)
MYYQRLMPLNRHQKLNKQKENKMFHQTWQLRTSQWIVALLAALLVTTGMSWTVQAAAPETQTKCVQSHTVKRGENLYRIALRYNTNMRTLQQLNNISNPNRIYVGQKLCVKVGSVTTPAPAPTVPEAKPTDVQYVTALEALRVRRGPGLQHAIVGGLIKGQTATVTGISPDGNWWRILCPSGSTTGTCWVTANASLTRPVYPDQPGGHAQAAIIESVSVQVRESYPLQIVAVVRGYLPDGCTYIDRFRQLREGRSIRIELITGRNPGFCTLALVPFEQVIHLDTAGWHSGLYSVVAGDARSDFYLP